MNHTTNPKIERLFKLFNPKVISRKKISGIPLEVDNYIKDFGGQNWLTAPTKAYEQNTDALILMDDHILKFFIAGYIRTIIEGSQSCLEEEFVYYVGTDHFISLTEHLTYEQSKYIFEFVLKLCEAESCYRLTQEKVLKNYRNYEESHSNSIN